MSGNDTQKPVKIEWTEAQKKAIDYSGGDLLVSASAGSGKTTVMLGRVMRLIREGGSIDRMLISTFTVSAADDMRVKLARRLREAYAESGDKRYLEELDKLPGADICTLDKWCQKIVRKYFYVCGDDPAFDIADGAESRLWINAGVDAAFAEEEERSDEDYVELCACFIKRRSDEDLKDIVRGMILFASARENGREWIKNAAHAYSSDEWKPFVEEKTESVRRAARRMTDAFEAAAESAGLGAEAEKFVDELRYRLDGGASGEPWARISGPVSKLPDLKDMRSAAKELVTEAEKLTELIASARDEEAERFASKLSQIALRATDIYDGIKAERGKLDFSDVQRRALAILSGKEGDEIRASYDCVFIDESQDINPMQESIIARLGSGNLFFVGDVKQSIYAFRNCEPKAFLRKKEELECSGGTVELNANYRSSSGILGFCNDLFSRIMTSDFGEIDYAGEGAFAFGGSAADGSVEIFTFGKEKKEERQRPDFSVPYSVRSDDETMPCEEDEGSAAEEADAIVRRITALVEEGMSYDDIAVIYRSRNAVVPLVAEGLAACGIPATSMSAAGIADGRVSKLLVSVLSLANNFYDDVPLVNVMLSPIGGFSEDDLAEMRAAFPEEKHFFGCVEKCSRMAGGEKVRAFLSKTDEYARLSRIMRPGELAGVITSDNRLFAAALSEPSGASRADELGRLLGKASAFGGTLSEFLEQLPEIAAERDKIMPPGSVRIMTVHASKGLEFKAVILCGLGKRYNLKSSSAVSVTDDVLGLGIESRSSADNMRLPSHPLLAIRFKAEKAAKEEEMRILYVALTRAKQKLILPLPEAVVERARRGEEKPPESAVTFAELIAPTALTRLTDAPREPAERFRGKVAPEADARVLGRLYEKTRPAVGDAPSDIKKTVTGLIAENVPTEDYALGVKTLTGAEYEGEGAGEAMRRGTAYHEALENADFALSAYEQAARLKACVADFDLVDLDKLDAAINAVRTVTAGASLYREQPFVMKTDDELLGERAGLIVQGVIDLMAVRGGECEITDYKTGGINAARREKYTRQLAIYSQAAEKLLGLKVVRARAYLIDEKRFMD